MRDIGRMRMAYLGSGRDGMLPQNLSTSDLKLKLSMYLATTIRCF